VRSIACLVSQHAIRHHVKDRKYPYCAGTIRPVMCRLSRKPDGRDENIPPPTIFRYFLFLAKEDPDIDVSPIFLSREQARFRKRPPVRPGQIQLCQPVVKNHNSFSGSSAWIRRSPIGKIPTAASFPVSSPGLLPPVLHILYVYVQQGYSHIGFLKY